MSRVINILLVSGKELAHFYPCRGMIKEFGKMPIRLRASGTSGDFFYVPIRENQLRWGYDVREGISVTHVAMEGFSACDGLTDKVKRAIFQSLGGRNTVDAVFLCAGANDAR